MVITGQGIVVCSATMGREITGLFDKGNPRVLVPEESDTFVRRIALTGSVLCVALVSKAGDSMLGDTLATSDFSGVRFGTIMTVWT